MTAQTLLDELKVLRIRIEPRPNGNLYVIPKNRMPPELLEVVRQHKAEILAAIAASARVEASRERKPFRFQRCSPTSPTRLRLLHEARFSMTWPSLARPAP
jgi:hypothetical protein